MGLKDRFVFSTCILAMVVNGKCQNIIRNSSDLEKDHLKGKVKQVSQTSYFANVQANGDLLAAGRTNFLGATDEFYGNFNGLQNNCIIQYNANGQITCLYVYNPGPYQANVPVEQNHYKYNSQGRLILYSSFDANNSLNSKTRYVYGAGSRLLKEIKWTRDYMYTADGRRQPMAEDGGSDVDSSFEITTYTYNENGYLVGKDFTNNNTPEETLQILPDYTLIRDSVIYKEYKKDNTKRRVVLGYDLKGNIKLLEGFNAIINKLDYKCSRTYNDSGCVIKQTIWSADSMYSFRRPEYILQFTYTYKYSYDSNGNWNKQVVYNEKDKAIFIVFRDLEYYNK